MTLLTPARIAAVEKLTPRQREILSLYGEGKPMITIAGQLFRTRQCVKKHTRNIKSALGLSSIQELTAFAGAWRTTDSAQ